MTLLTKSRQRIDQLGQSLLADIDPSNLPFQIHRAAHSFKTALEQEALYDEDNEQPITHSEKYLMDSGDFTRVKEMLELSADLFDTEFCCVTNKNTGDGIIFIGSSNHVYASRCLFACLSPIVLAIRDHYLPKVARFKKEETRERKINDYMSEWLDSVFGRDRYHRRRGNYETNKVADYIRAHFSTTEDQQDWLKSMIDVLEPLCDSSSNDAGISIKEIKKALQKQFPGKTPQQTAENLEAFRNKDMVMLFLCDDAIRSCFESEVVDDY